MAGKRLDVDWEMASAVLCMIYNAHCGKGRSKTPNDFNPRRKRVSSGVPLTADTISVLKCFVAKEHGGSA